MKQRITSIRDRLLGVAHTLRRYVLPLFLGFLLCVYGFLAWRVITLERVEPSQTEVSAKLKSAGVPHVDADVVEKIQELQDNSVEARSLFDQARANPFQE